MFKQQKHYRRFFFWLPSGISMVVTQPFSGWNRNHVILWMNAYFLSQISTSLPKMQRKTPQQQNRPTNKDALHML